MAVTAIISAASEVDQVANLVAAVLLTLVGGGATIGAPSPPVGAAAGPPVTVYLQSGEIDIFMRSPVDHAARIVTLPLGGTVYELPTEL